jgi:hypothetical protein
VRTAARLFASRTLGGPVEPCGWLKYVMAKSSFAQTLMRRASASPWTGREDRAQNKY